LAADVLCRSGELRLGVTGASMLPCLWPGDLLLIRRAQLSEIAPEDLVLFFRQQRFFVHRVLAASDDRLLTQGDGLAIPDPPVTANELLGRVDFILRYGAVSYPAPLGTFGRALAFAVRRSTMFCRILLRLHLVRRRFSRASAAAMPRTEAACPS